MLFYQALIDGEATVIAMIKRMFDIAAGLVGLVLLFPFLVIVGILIKLDSAGPAFYRGIRAGRHGRPFRIFKFRTMVRDAEELGGGTTALRDSRITKIGTFLRRYKIDELPQLLNVIKGDMSFVGPRPELLQYTRNYTGAEICILDVRPGITDLSSIEFISLDEHVGHKDADNVFEKTVLPLKNRLRIKYVQEKSVLLDIKIILKTIFKILSKFCKREVKKEGIL